MQAITSGAFGLAALIATAAGTAACGGSGDKSGAATEPKVTLTLQMPDRGDPIGKTFADTVTRRSGGSVRIRFGRGYENTVPANELRLARALRGGKADIGYLPARAWATDGIPAFRALLAPFSVSTLKAQAAIATGPLGATALDALPKDVIGLALLPGEARRVISKRPVSTPADYARLRLGVFDDPQSVAAFKALGATTVTGKPWNTLGAELRAGRLDGVEVPARYILLNAYWNTARHLSGYGVFPRFDSIVINRAAWERLSPAQRRAVSDAAAAAARSAPGVVAERERADVRQLCEAGVRVTVPTKAQMIRLAAAARPAIAGGDHAAARLLAGVRTLPGTGPQPLAVPLPTECTVARRAVAEDTRPAASFPEGVYVTKVTSEQLHAAGAAGPQTDKDLTFTTRFRDGRWTQTQTPTYPDQCADVPTADHGPCAGPYRVRGDTITLTWAAPTPPPYPAPETVRWSYLDGVLRFKVVDVADPASVAIYTQPWHRVG
jgi:TRAP-type C4-dicarboxylate transport system substrate-binding protein